MMLVASVLGILSVYAGLLASYHLNLAAGATVTLVAAGLFFLLFAAKQLLGLTRPPVRGNLEGQHGQ